MASNPPPGPMPPGAGGNPPPNKPTAAPPAFKRPLASVKPALPLRLQASLQSGMPSMMPSAVARATTNDIAPKPPSQPTPRPMPGLQLKPTAGFSGVVSSAGAVKPSAFAPTPSAAPTAMMPSMNKNNSAPKPMTKPPIAMAKMPSAASAMPKKAINPKFPTASSAGTAASMKMGSSTKSAAQAAAKITSSLHPLTGQPIFKNPPMKNSDAMFQKFAGSKPPSSFVPVGAVKRPILPTKNAKNAEMKEPGKAKPKPAKKKEPKKKAAAKKTEKKQKISKQPPVVPPGTFPNLAMKAASMKPGGGLAVAPGGPPPPKLFAAAAPTFRGMSGPVPPYPAPSSATAAAAGPVKGPASLARPPNNNMNGRNNAPPPNGPAPQRPPYNASAGPSLAEMNRVTKVVGPPSSGAVPASSGASSSNPNNMMPNSATSADSTLYGSGQQQPMHPSGTRMLKVEDALLYLDEVKMEFGDQPRVYNEFLEIMKNFKAQTMDTIGVINSVRKLFHGYNNLILGFNTFLPDGYKIEMRDLEPVVVGPGLPGTNSTTAIPGYMPVKPPPGAAGRGMPGRGPPPGLGGRGLVPTGFGRGGRGMPLPGRGMPPQGRGMPPQGRGMPPPGRGIPGRGPPPPNAGRGLPIRGRGGPPHLGPGLGRGMVAAEGRGRGPMPAGRGGLPPPQPSGGMQPMPQQQAMQQQMQAQNAKQHAQMQAPQQQPHQQAVTQGPSQAQQQQGDSFSRSDIEFDHAIMYVTNIKKRFADQPRIYHTFLEILQTYQKEQRGIKEVLEQVSSLFADHPDLLREFTFFLPEGVQEQATERLSRAAAEAEAKQRAAAVEAAAQQQAQQVQAQQQLRVETYQAQVESGKNSKSAPTGWRATSATHKSKPGQQQPPATPTLTPSEDRKMIDMTHPDAAGLSSPPQSRPTSSTTAVITAATTTATQQTKEIFTYNSGVERQFFDAIKVALTSFSRDGQAYAEFIKTLDMYAQEILKREDMMGYVERLLGKHKDLFEEFKRIINAVGSPDAPTHDDDWHSVPLSEIDFTRCRRCSPSYRALPRDYPNAPCNERSDMEVSVLNDVWVSLPLGSEENNTFRHMRKNQYEETLFRCEDMRFEIDMCIDSNATTLQRLTKINDELQFLSERELPLSKGPLVKKTLCPDGAGLGGKVYQYTLDGRVLGIIHKLSIKRIYGEDGQEMLDLCYKNPAVALPIVVNRLRQKDQEWRAAREVLNGRWKDLGESNYYKSVDHRSITWRTVDKRATSTRTIVAEIKDRALHGGLEGDAAHNARIEKAKEEHGAFYEITMASSIPRKMDLTNLPKPTETIFTPHVSFAYDTSWAQQDAYRIISFALERGSISPVDKEACFEMWRDFLAPWFGLNLSWMQSPASLFKASFNLIPDESEDDEMSTDDTCDESRNEDNVEISVESNIVVNANGNLVKEEIMKPESSTDYLDTGFFSSSNHIPFPPDTLVSTTFGKGKVVQYHQEDGLYEVSYPSSKHDDGIEATAYLRPDAVYGSLPPVEPSLLTDQLRTNDHETLKRSDDKLIIGTQYLYLFFRLHQVLVRRLVIAKKLAFEVSNDTALGRHIEKLTFEGDPDEGKKRYEAFLGLVYSLIDGGANGPSSLVESCLEGGKYEDRVRSLLGNNAYELTTMDKLISHILKHLQNMANDDTLQNMIEIYRRHEQAGSFKPSAFREEAALMSEGENMYAFQLCDMARVDQKICHVEFLGCIAEDVDEEEKEKEHGETAADDNELYDKRGIGDVSMNDIDDAEAQAAKRPRAL